MYRWIVLLSFCGVLLPAPAAADNDLDVTMTPMTGEQRPDDVTRRIVVPDGASEETAEDSRLGLERSDEARGDDDRAPGQDTAAEARERSQSGRDAADRARDLGRGSIGGDRGVGPGARGRPDSGGNDLGGSRSMGNENRSDTKEFRDNRPGGKGPDHAPGRGGKGSQGRSR